jgi:hypothetical protein
MGVGSQRHDPAALPPGKTRYTLYRRLGGPQGRSGRLWKILPPPGFDPRTVQTVARTFCKQIQFVPHREHVNY